MDKNDHAKALLGGYSERIGDWTPQQLQDFIQSLSNDPNAMPHSFQTRQIHVTENLVVGGKQYEHAVFPRGMTMGDPKGKGTAAYPVLSGSQPLNRAYHALDPSTKHIFAETFDARHADAATIDLASGTGRMQAIYVPNRERCSHMYVNYGTFEVGGTFTYGGWALYGPLVWTPGTGVNKAAVPQVFITETNTVTTFRNSGSHFVSDGMHAYTGWDVVLHPGIYFVVGLYVFSVAPTTPASVLAMTSTAPGVATPNLLVPHFINQGSKVGMTTLPATLDTTSFNRTNAQLWAALYDDSTKQI